MLTPNAAVYDVTDQYSDSVDKTHRWIWKSPSNNGESTTYPNNYTAHLQTLITNSGTSAMTVYISGVFDATSVTMRIGGASGTTYAKSIWKGMSWNKPMVQTGPYTIQPGTTLVEFSITDGDGTTGGWIGTSLLITKSDGTVTVLRYAESLHIDHCGLVSAQVHRKATMDEPPIIPAPSLVPAEMLVGY